ncbi:MAG TPA: hypothetical protein VE397_20705 [Stellaceae bacterium]|jgi:hypothetical protein|nr:hypothetical protein [Stellaceae bacterium]
MVVKRFAAIAALASAGLVLATLGAAPASARVVVGVGIGVPLYAPGPYYYPYPPPVVYAPPPVVYSPPPVIVAPAAPAYIQQSSQTWYYCDNPQGYYPYVNTCNTGWREVPAQPAR